MIDPAYASLLGSPIGDTSSTSDAISGKTQLLLAKGEGLQHVSAHDALLLLRNSFAIPKLLYLLRSSPSFLSPNLKDYDDVLISIVGTIANTCLDDNAWNQVSLPVKAGGLGIRSAVQLAPSAFLSSAAASSDLVHHILPPRFGSQEFLTLILPLRHGLLIRTILHLWLLLPIARRFGTPSQYLRQPMPCWRMLLMYCLVLASWLLQPRVRRLVECPAHLLFWLEDGRQHCKSICGPPSWYHPLSSLCLPPLQG